MRRCLRRPTSSGGWDRPRTWPGGMIGSERRCLHVRVRQRRCWDRRESSQVPHAGEQKMLITLRLVFIFWMVCPFLYFMSAAANTFTVPKLHDNGAALGQISFLSGMVCVLIMGLFHGLLVPFAIGG